MKWKRAREIGLNQWKKVEKVQKGDYTSTKKKLGQIIGENSEKISVLSGKLRGGECGELRAVSEAKYEQTLICTHP